MNILLTGASGFVGSALYKYLNNSGHHVHIIDREKLDSELSFQNTKFDVLIHLAARAHVMHENMDDVYNAYANVNVVYTRKTAALAKRLNIKRFIFLSSVKVNGEQTAKFPFRETDTPKPEDNYGLTKYEAEQLLKDTFDQTTTELVIIRPPLIYGHGVKANFNNLIKLSKVKTPLPFGSIHNKRSMVYIGNLIDFIGTCSTHPNAANETFLISDDNDISTTVLIRTIRKSLDMPAWLIPIPKRVIIYLLRSIGKKSLAVRICGNLQVDISKAKQLLNWKPPYTFEQGVKGTIQDA